MVGVLRTRPALLNERMKGLIQKGQPAVDRAIILSFLVAYGCSFVLIPLDVFGYHLLPAPPLWVSTAGLVLLIAGWLLVALSFRDNPFAVPVVRHQTEREHAVADTGVYSVIRHPLYAGVILFNVGIPLWLESYAAAIVALVAGRPARVAAVVRGAISAAEIGGVRCLCRESAVSVGAVCVVMEGGVALRCAKPPRRG